MSDTLTTPVRTATSRDEAAGWFEAGPETLFGIVTRPVADPVGVGVVVLPGGGRPLATNRGGFSVRFAREVAGLGFHAMRFDYHGTGESTGDALAFKLHDPFPADLQGAVRCARGHGVERFVLMGSCFGARAALWVAAEDPSVEGVVLIATPVRDLIRGERIRTRIARDNSVRDYVTKALRPETLRGLADRDRRRTYARLVKAKWESLTRRRRSEEEWNDRYRLSRRFVDQLTALRDRGTRVLFVFGDADDLHAEFKRARAEGPFADLMASAGDRFEVAVVPGRVHGFVELAPQRQVARVVRDWLRAGWTSA